MAGEGWIKVANSFQGRLDNKYGHDEENPNVRVYLDLDTVGFDDTSEDNLQDLITDTVETHFQKACSVVITAYTVSDDTTKPTMFEKLLADEIDVKPYKRRIISCWECKDRRERERAPVVVGKKHKLLELELLEEICLQAMYMKSNPQRESAIWIISSDPFFTEYLFHNLKDRNVEVYSVIPEGYMFAVPMYQDMT